MDYEYHTLTLAKVYESQGYYQNAKEIYDRCNEKFQGKDTDIQAACARMKAALENAVSTGMHIAEQNQHTDSKNGKTRVAAHLEEWVRLLILQKRLGLFHRIQARVL